MHLKPLGRVVLQHFSLCEEMSTLIGIHFFGGTYSLVQLRCEFWVSQWSVDISNDSAFYSMTLHGMMSSLN